MDNCIIVMNCHGYNSRKKKPIRNLLHKNSSVKFQYLRVYYKTKQASFAEVLFSIGDTLFYCTCTSCGIGLWIQNTYRLYHDREKNAVVPCYDYQLMLFFNEIMNLIAMLLFRLFWRVSLGEDCIVCVTDSVRKKIFKVLHHSPL